MTDNMKYTIAILSGMVFGALIAYLEIKFIKKPEEQIDIPKDDKSTIETNSIFINNKPDIESFKDKYKEATEAVKNTADAFENVAESIEEAKEIINAQGYFKKENIFGNKEAKVIDDKTFIEAQEAGSNVIEYCITMDDDITIIDDINELVSKDELEFIPEDLLKDFKETSNEALYLYYQGTYYAIYKVAYTYEEIVIK